MTSTARSRMTHERQAEVLDAVMDIIREVGYERLTFDAVAARAHTSKATLYRLWQDKPGLVVSALENHKRPNPPAEPGASLAEDLAALATRRPERPGREELELTFGLMRAAAFDPEFGEAVRRVILAPAIAELTEIFVRAAARGEIRFEPRLFDRIARSIVECYLFSALLTGHDLPPIDEHIDVLVKPALTFLTVRS